MVSLSAGVAETVTVTEGIAADPFQVSALNGELIVSVPDLDFDGVEDLGNYSIRPDTTSAPVFLASVETGFDAFQGGSFVYVVDVAVAQLPVIGVTPPVKGQTGISSNVLDFGGTAAFTQNDVLDFIRVKSGQNVGVYQITSVYTTNDGIDAPHVTRITLDRPLVVRDHANGYVEALVEIVDADTNTYRLVHPNVDVGDPLIEILRIDNRTTLESALLPALLDPTKITFIDHETFSYNDTLFTTSPTDRVFVQARISPKVDWQHTSGVKTLTFETSKFTDGGQYFFTIKNLFTKKPHTPFIADDVEFDILAGTVDKPQVVGASFDDGIVTVTYDQDMRVDDANLANLDDYTITGVSAITVKRVFLVNPTQVAIEAMGWAEGAYTLTVSSSTPTDVAGNPLDPSFNSAIFSGSVPLAIRSVFTDRGPIARPALTLQTGSNATLDSFTDVTLPGAVLTASEVGQYVRLTGSALNDGTFRISGVLSPTQPRLANTSFSLPDANSGSIAWEVFDPRTGQIADDPSDVTVRVNGTPVTPEAVVGLLGQVILDTEPAPSDDVKIDYSWCCNPNIEVRRLNSKEFRFNSWDRDLGFPQDPTQHKYRYNNTLIRPSDFEALNLSATLDQPELRELHYRAYEREYTPVFNDPNLLLFNSPIHKIAFPQASRILSEEFVTYEGTGLPEGLVVNPWSRVGTGQASSTLGVLTVGDDVTGVFPTGEPVFWTRPLDLTFQHVFAMSWRFSLDLVTTLEGVFTGVAAGYSDERAAAVLGFLDDGGTKKIGFLKLGAADDPSIVSAWTGGIDIGDAPTSAPVEFDWSVLHSYRLFRDLNGTIKLFIDGDVDETLRMGAAELPSLGELNAPFDAIQGAFFGSLSRPAESTSSWDFVRYLTLPTNPQQTSPSSFVSYEANVFPELDPKPWTPVGFHGTETILSSDFLLLDNTSATDPATADAVGLVGGDHKGFIRMEPLLSSSAEVVYDTDVQLLTHTHGISPTGLMLAVDDGSRLIQLAFFPDRETPKLSYGGRSLPEDFSPFAWTALGGSSATMAGRILRIADADVGGGKVYSIDDAEPSVSDDRVVEAGIDSILEFRNKVVSFTADGSGFAGAFAQAFDSIRAVGLLLQEDVGVKYVAFHSDGVTGGLARFAFDWDDGDFHTYRITKSTSGNLISLFIDGEFVGSETYSSFAAPPPDPIGQISWGSSTPASAGSLSVVDWAYVNAWRVRSDLKHFIGIWKGSDNNSLLGYHLPLKTSGRGANVQGNTLGDGNADFIAAGVTTGDKLIVDAGSNREVYEVAGVADGQNLTITGMWPSSPSLVDYRIAKETDWTVPHKYRITRDSTGTISVLFDAETDPLIQIGYNSIDLPISGLGIVRTLSNGLPAMVFGSFDSENLSQSKWDFVRYGLIKSVTELRIAPHHQVLNQWNVMASPEHTNTTLPHEHTDFKSSSTGIPPKKDPDFLENALLAAFTQLNEGTPLVPSTQTYEVRAPFPIQETVSGLNRPEDVLNSDGDFTFNDGALRFKLIVPDDVLYSCLDVIEQVTGEPDLLAPFDDFQCGPDWGTFFYTSEVCLDYDGNVLPEDDATAATPWELVSDDPAEASSSAFSGLLTYSTSATGTKTVYRNNSPLPDAPSLETEARFRMKVLADSSLGTGDSQIRIGMSAPGMTVALGFVTTSLSERLVLVIDLNSGGIVGSASFDYLDGAFHTYRIVRNPSSDTVEVFIDS